MRDRLLPFIAPIYLLLCIVLGGSAQGVWGNAALRLLAIPIIAWALVSRRSADLDLSTKRLLLLIALALAALLLQLIPMPWSIWTALPGRQQFAADFNLLGIVPSALATSLAPYDGMSTLITLLPPLAMIAALLSIRDTSPAWLAAALIFGTVAAVLLGILQVTNGPGSGWYPYRVSNFGHATGFFANSNHMASLLLVTIPFIAALGAIIRERSKDLRLTSAATALAGGGLMVIILGLFLNGSLAGFGLGIPVILASLLVLFGPKRRYVGATVVAIAAAALIALVVIWKSPMPAATGTSLSSRQEMLSHSVDLIRTFGWPGSGLGTFEKVYRLTEDPNHVGLYYVNHAHNDYVELAVELGIVGTVILLLFLAWWARAVLTAARSLTSDQISHASAIASAALLLHSAVDFPLRTAAMSSVFAMCLVLIVQSRRATSGDTDLRPVRHVVIG